MKSTKLSDQTLTDLLTRGVDNIIEAASLKRKLLSGKKLRIKHGVDPTTADLHLGYSVVYRKLRAFQDLGHTIIFLIGDFTARFGDPTDKIQSRQLREKKDVAAAAQSYLDQLGLILDLKKTEIRRNSEWYDRMSAEELLRLQSRFTVARLLERDMFQKRQAEGKEIGYHEPVYPILQAHDSVMLKSDVTVIGTDQTFNELQARTLQREVGQEPQDIMAMKLLVGTDGKRKMSQSIGNAIGLTDAPDQMFGKIMSIPDEQIIPYLELTTGVPLSEIAEIRQALSSRANPRDAKARLATEIVTLYHGPKAAGAAMAEFNQVFTKHQTPSDIPDVKISATSISPLDLLIRSDTVKSKTEARRLIEQRSVTIDGQTLADWKTLWPVKKGAVVQVGKRRFFRVA